MAKGIVRDFVWLCTGNLGTVCIEDIETHKVDMVPYERKAAVERHKGKIVYWECNEGGMLSRLEPVKGQWGPG